MSEEKTAAESEERTPPDEGGLEDAGDQVAAELDELGQTKRERDEYLELAQRTRADFENFRKRAARDSEQARQRAVADLAAALIPAVDNLERALIAAGVDPNRKSDDTPDDAAEEAALSSGLVMIHRQLREVLENAGVESYDPKDEKFDPAWHEALQTRPDERAESGQVIETLEKGYRLDGQVLRPARVVVAD
jgi:molecular chaperone GrpE